MDGELVKRLVRLNFDFYSRFAVPFAKSRPAAAINLEPLRPYLDGARRVLDIGCGNGRWAKALDGEGHRLEYVGLDAVPALIELGRSHAATLSNLSATFQVADVSSRGWSESLQTGEPFDLVLVLAVFHHLPSMALRAALLANLFSLARPGAYLVMSNWQFTNSPRLVNKIVPWSRVGIEEHDLETGDCLLSWKRGGLGYRYCHLLGEGEVETLAIQSGWQVCDQFLADGDLNLYSVLQRP